jgi:hypothetical protein
MKIYQSPLIILSFFLFIYSLYLLTDKGSGPMGFGMLLFIPLLLFSIAGVLLHLLIAAFLPNRKWQPFLAEVLIIIIFFIWLLFINR